MNPSTALPRRRIKPVRALLIDDDAFFLAFVSDMLQDLGAAEVTTARSGSEGRQAYDRLAREPDVVLCDLHMPDTDGFQFMEFLAERKFKGGVVVVSGMDARTVKSAALMGRFHRLKVLGTIHKPFDAQTLGNALATLD